VFLVLLLRIEQFFSIWMTNLVSLFKGTEFANGITEELLKFAFFQRVQDVFKQDQGK
jgi:hypothetical protein